MTDETTNPLGDVADHTNADTGVDTSTADDSAEGEFETETEGQDDAEGDGEGDEGSTEADDDDSEEIEHAGQKYKIPKAVKPLLLMQSDYTRKTQEVANERKTLESRAAEITQRAEASRALIAEHAKLHTIKTDLATYDALSQEQWDALKAKDIDAYRDHKDAHRDLKDQAARLGGEIEAKEKEALSAQERAASEALATQRREMAELLTGAKKTDGPDISIPNLNAEHLSKLGKFATQKYGVSAEELGQITDARIIRLLHDAHVGAELQARQKQAKTITTAQQTKPAKQVGSGAPNARRTTDASGDGLSADEWARRERERLAARNKRA